MSKRYSKTDLLDRLHVQAEALGRTPTQGELVAPTGRTYVRRFGSYKAAVHEAGLPEPRVRFRRIRKWGYMILQDDYVARRPTYLRRLHSMLLRTLGNGHAILKDSFFVGLADPERAGFTEAPQAKIRMLTIFLGKRKVRGLPEFPMSNEEISACGLGAHPAMSFGLSIAKVKQVVATATTKVTPGQLAEKLIGQLEARLAPLAPGPANR